jgi:hypothetical protein
VSAPGTVPDGLAGPPAPLPALADVLVAALEALAAAGEPRDASRLAGRACAALRHDAPGEWRKFNALLHRLSRQISPDAL